VTPASPDGLYLVNEEKTNRFCLYNTVNLCILRWYYLHTLCNVQNQLNISIIVVVGSTGDWYVVVSHFYILRVSC
jgi:hypothetical protein